MSVTIGNMSSNLNLVDSSTMISEAVMEQIIRQVMLRLRDQQYAEAQRQRDQEIQNQSTASAPF